MVTTRILWILSCRPRFHMSRCILLVDMDTTYAVRKWKRVLCRTMHGAISSPQGFKRLAVWRQPAVLADCKGVGMRMSTLQICMLEKHMSESAWWCFLPSGVPMGSHMSVVTCMKVCVLADSGSGLPMLKVKMDYPIWAARWSYAWNSSLPTLALRIAVHVPRMWLALAGAARLFRCSRTTWAIAQRWQAFFRMSGCGHVFPFLCPKSGHFRCWKLGCRA